MFVATLMGQLTNVFVDYLTLEIMGTGIGGTAVASVCGALVQLIIVYGYILL